MTITPADLAGMLEMLAQALRLMPAAAAQAAAAAVGPVIAPADAAPAAAQQTLAEWLDVHERLLGERGYMAQTMKNRCTNLRHVRRLWGHRPIAALKPHEVATGLKTFPPKRSSTAGRVLSELREAYTEAIANGWADTNPARDIKPPKHSVTRARLRMETWSAMRTLSTASSQRWVESMLLLALLTGQRRSDLAKMRFDDVVTGSDGQQVLRIEQQKKAGKPIGARVEIPLTLRMDAIGMTVGDVIEHCRHSALPGPTMLRKAGGGAIEQSSLSARFHEHILAVLGPDAHQADEWPSLHEARSLSARMYLQQGMPREVVQTLLGHKHAEMTDAYTDDRGLSAAEWKRVAVPTASAPA